MPAWSTAPKPGASSPAVSTPSRCATRSNGSIAIKSSGRSGSIALPRSWTKKNPFRRRKEPGPPNRHKPEPHHQTPPQRAAGKSLRGVDRPGKSEALDGARRGQGTVRGKRPARRRPLSLGDAGAERRGARRRRRLSRGRAQPEARIHLGLEDDARTLIAGDGAAQARRRRHVVDADPRAVRRRRRPRPPSGRLERRHGQDGEAVRLSFAELTQSTRTMSERDRKSTR